MFLLDSNIVIYAAQPEHGFLIEFIAARSPAVSAVTLIEVLGYHKLTTAEKEHFEAFFSAALVIQTSAAITLRAAALRQAKKTSLGDAVVAATALETGRTLVTRNVKDFEWVEGLNVLNPFDAEAS